MWNGSIQLPKNKVIEVNENGIEKEHYEYVRGIPANFTDATRNDELLAAQKGYNAEQNIEIAACNYAGQSFLVDEATQDVYDIKRTHRKDKSMMLILTCERRERGRGAEREEYL